MGMEKIITTELNDDKDEEFIFYKFIDTLKLQIAKLKQNVLLLNELKQKKMKLHKAEADEYDKLAQLEECIGLEKMKSSDIRDKIMYLDQSIHLKEKVVAEQDFELIQTTDKISNAFNKYIDLLDIRLKFKQKEVLNAKIINFEVIVNSVEICLAYDLVAEQYDLINLHPIHPKFDDIQRFLNRTSDISGFLVSVYLWSSKMKKNEFNS